MSTRPDGIAGRPLSQVIGFESPVDPGLSSPAVSARTARVLTVAGFAAVAFDLFETLVTEFDPHWQSAPTDADRLGVPPSCFAEVWRARREDRMTKPVDYRDVLRQVCSVTDVETDQHISEVIESLHAERLTAKARPLTRLDDRILESLRRLRSTGLNLGLISNCSIEEVAAWESSPLAEFFDDVTFSYQVGVAKPNPAIYLGACSRLGVEPEQVAFVGDGGSDELVGAQHAGLAPYWARWFLDQWPPQYVAGRAERLRGYPSLTSPDDLIHAFGD